ncbi:hypothetical protein [Nitrosopumilus sp.]|uniref:hypothetical protein n=1 Tax=Nitrosopumilus sp. TaxID=2024843 RepID=UPI0034A0917A
MTDPLLDDVKALLDKDFGDDRILKQIRRACEHNEVISNYERNYVRELAEKHLGKKPEFKQTIVNEKPIVPDVIIPQTHFTQQSLQTPSRISYSKSKNKKIFLGIGSLALVIIIVVAVSFSGISDGVPKINDTKNPTSLSLSVQTDLTSYGNKDLISISGTSNTSKNVNLSIRSPSGDLVWTEQLSLKSDGRYSTLAIAGGPNWQSFGTYTITVDNGVETKSNTFSFNA